MKKVCLYAVMFLFSAVVFAAGETEATTMTKKAIKVVNPDDFNFSCEKYMSGDDSTKAIEYYSLYREFFKQKNYDEAMKYWPFVYKNVPRFNSRIINNGISYYQGLVDAETVEGARKDELVDSLIMLYYHKLHCYGKKTEDQIKYQAKIGHLYQKYRPTATDEIKNIYGEVIMKAKNDAPYYTLEPYFKYLLIDLDNKKVTPDEVLEAKEMIEGIVAANSDDEKYGAKFQQIGANIDDLFSNNKGVQDLFDCEAMKPKWQEQFTTMSNDESWVKDIYRKMRSRKCVNDPFTKQLEDHIFAKWPTGGGYMKKASAALKAKDYPTAITWIEKANTLETDPMTIAGNHYKIAEIKYATRDFSGARKYAKMVIAARPDWGKPYLLIGKLYASSGNVCNASGSTGFDSQRVIWPAIDYFQKAKNVDPSVADDAQALISKYWAYLPTKEDLFMMGHKSGDSYFVPCWIQESTTIRTK